MWRRRVPASSASCSRRPARPGSSSRPLLWLLTILAASRLTIPARLRTRRVGDETLIDLSAEPSTALPDDDRTGFGGWVDELVAGEGTEVADGPPRGDAP